MVVNLKGEVLIVNQNHNSWSLPKGHIDPGEDALQAAMREVYEESGIRNLELLADFGVYERPKIGLDGQDDRSEIKEIHMFLFKTPDMDLKPLDPHNPIALWVSPDKIAERLTHPRDKDFFKGVIGKISAR